VTLFEGHGLHLVVLLLGWALAVVAWTMKERLESPVTALAVLSSAVGGAVHLLVTPAHFAEATTYGVFFLVLTVAQLAWAVGYLRWPDPRLLYAGAAVSAFTVVLWLETRLVGLHIGPLRAGTEGFGWLDGISSGAELVLVVLAVVHAARRRPRLARTPAVATL
jgi:hypothetical protein